MEPRVSPAERGQCLPLILQKIGERVLRVPLNIWSGGGGKIQGPHLRCTDSFLDCDANIILEACF